ncbi:MAG: hydrogenase maturation nickel metallochaperone HypA [Ignavibacteriae bacterium]|nr:hydrogenase maturation nickel metallochaperone HypA [Ignavibacteriota bacterium]
MHELSIAQSVVDIVLQHVSADEAHRVKAVFLKVGDLAGVVPDSLEFGFTAITAGTALENAKLRIERIPFTIRCLRCGATSTQEIGISICAQCGSLETTTIGGTELHITEIEVNDPEETS